MMPQPLPPSAAAAPHLEQAGIVEALQRGVPPAHQPIDGSLHGGRRGAGGGGRQHSAYQLHQSAAVAVVRGEGEGGGGGDQMTE